MSNPELSKVARELESLDPEDQAALQQGLRTLQGLRETLRKNDSPELAVCIGAVAQLVQALAGSRETISRQLVKGIACRTLFALGSDVGGLRIEKTPESNSASQASQAAQPSPPADAQASPAAPVAASQAAPNEKPSPAAAKKHAPETAAQKPALYPPPEARPQMPKKADMSFGRMLVELGHVTREQVASALRFHRSKGPRIGECLLLQGAISPEHLLNALKIQDLLRATPQGVSPATLARYKEVEKPTEAGSEQPRPEARVKDAAQRVTEGIFLGEVMLGAGMITNDQLEKALHIHHHTGARVGEALIQIGASSEADVQSGIQLQDRLRHIAGMKAA